MKLLFRYKAKLQWTHPKAEENRFQSLPGYYKQKASALKNKKKE